MQEFLKLIVTLLLEFCSELLREEMRLL